MKHISLLVLAAGLGSRYQGQKQIDGVTDHGEALMEFALYDALKMGVSKVVFVINERFPSSFKERLTTSLSSRNCAVYFIKQTRDKFLPEDIKPYLKNREKPLGTAHAVYCAKEVIDEPFMTINADDFYGPHSFASAFKWVEDGNISTNRYAMVGFSLKNTLSENGPVSRGLCRVDNQVLKGVEEYKSIAFKDGAIKGVNDKTQVEKPLDPNALVSMNFWVLHPSFFEAIKKSLPVFVEESDDLSTDEFYLPWVIDQSIQQGEVEVRVLPTYEQWFGLTYRKDKTLAVGAIDTKKEHKIYPDNLWG